MAELLVRIADKVNVDDVYADVRCLKRGHVCAICEDGHQWSEAESNGTTYVVVKVQGMTVDDLSAFLVRELGDVGGDLRQNPMLQPRAFKVDMDTLLADQPIQAGGLGRDSHSIETSDGNVVEVPAAGISVDSADIFNYKLVCEPLTDPNVIDVGPVITPPIRP